MTKRTALLLNIDRVSHCPSMSYVGRGRNSFEYFVVLRILFKFNPEVVRLHQNIHANVNILNNISLEPIHLIQNYREIAAHRRLKFHLAYSFLSLFLERLNVLQF